MCTETRGIGMGLAVTRLEVSRQSWPAEGKVGAEVLLPTGEESEEGGAASTAFHLPLPELGCAPPSFSLAQECSEWHHPAKGELLLLARGQPLCWCSGHLGSSLRPAVLRWELLTSSG